jgi:hypothetical protein
VHRKSSTAAALVVGKLTKTGVEHVECHPVAFLRACNSNKPLVAIVLWLVNLDHAAADLPNLVDLLATLADDRADHVVRDVDLLSERCTRHSTMSRLALRSRMPLLAHVACLLRRHMGLGPVATGHRLGTVMDWHRWSGMLWLMRCPVWLGIWLRCHVWGSLILSALVVLAISIVASSGLWHVWHNLHAARYNPCRTAAAGCVRRGSRAAESLVELLQEGATHIVSSDMNGIGYAHHDQGTLSRQG